MKHQTPKLNRSVQDDIEKLQIDAFSSILASFPPFSRLPPFINVCLLFAGAFVKHRWESARRKVRVMHFFISFGLIWLPDDSTLIFVADKRANGKFSLSTDGMRSETAFWDLLASGSIRWLISDDSHGRPGRIYQKYQVLVKLDAFVYKSANFFIIFQKNQISSKVSIFLEVFSVKSKFSRLSVDLLPKMYPMTTYKPLIPEIHQGISDAR